MTQNTTPANWHALDAEAVFKRPESHADGLDQAQAKQRLEKAEPNSLETEDGVGAGRLLARQLNTPAI